MAPDPSARANGTERGCVEDQPQRVGSSKASRACSVLRLVEDDTAALRSPGPSQFHRVRISGAMNNEQFDASRPGIAKHITLNLALGPPRSNRSSRIRRKSLRELLEPLRPGSPRRSGFE